MFTEEELNVYLERQAEQVARLERGLSDVHSAMAVMMDKISKAFEGGIKKENSPPNTAAPAAPPADQSADRICALEEQLATLWAEAMMGNMKKEKHPESSASSPPENLSKSMFVDISEGGEGTTTVDKFGEVARALGKELKNVGSSSLKKNKLKSAASFQLWEKRFRKKISELQDIAALKRYLDFVGVVSFVTRHESWPVARYYAWR